MAFSSGSDNQGLPMAEINVTPLVDVMLVLLVIFMVTAPMMDQGVNIELPKTKGAALDSTAETQMLLKIYKDRTVRLNDSVIRVPELKERLRALSRNRKDKTLFVRADKDVPYGFVAYVIGEVKSSGLAKLGLITVPLEAEK